MAEDEDQRANAAMAQIDFETLANPVYYSREGYKGGDSSKIYSHFRWSKSCKVHSGYAERFGIIESESSAVKNLIVNDSSEAGVIFTGHSMGGSLAQLAALYALGLKKTGEEMFGSHPVSIIGFGTPPLFSGSMITALNLNFLVLHICNT